jgi:hypothetical protein
MSRFLFPRWSNAVLPLVAVGGAIAPLYIVFLIAYAWSPKTIEVGYKPTQPVPYSHALHVGQLGLDCRYCHTTVDRGAHASVPATQTCMNCHTQVQKDSPKLQPVRDSYANGLSVQWTRIHDLPDYSYFDHSAHVNRGVSCVECHGRVDQMEVVQKAEPMSMGWCLECHRTPTDRLRPLDRITQLSWDQRTEMTAEEREALKKLYHISPSENCSTCHR